MIRDPAGEGAARDELDELARREDAGESTSPPLRRSRNLPRDSSQVYSLRLPRGAIARLRELAEEREEPATSLLRHWILERLDVEREGGNLRSGPPGAEIEVVLRVPAGGAGAARVCRTSRVLEARIGPRLYLAAGDNHQLRGGKDAIR
jgi:hypothetical protein